MFHIDLDTQTSDKYDMAKFLDFGEDCVFNCLNSYFLYRIPKLPLAGYYVVRKEIGRPDMLSYNLYGDTQYWWILMWYNNMLKPQDLTSGITIKYPTLSNIEQLYMDATLQQKVL